MESVFSSWADLFWGPLRWVLLFTNTRTIKILVLGGSVSGGARHLRRSTIFHKCLIRTLSFSQKVWASHRFKIDACWYMIGRSSPHRLHRRKFQFFEKIFQLWERFNKVLICNWTLMQQKTKFFLEYLENSFKILALFSKSCCISLKPKKISIRIL